MEKLVDPMLARDDGRPFRLLSDDRLARCASRGDRQAIAAIFERYQQELYRFCLGLLGEPQDAQDAVQNTVVKVLRALPGEERRIALRPWLFRIAHNEAIELRRRENATELLDDHPVEARSSLAEQAEAREHLGWLLKDLGDLPERQRAVLVMRELSGLDFVEIGSALGTSGAVVRQSLYEARRSLQRMDLGRNLKCEVVTRALSDADGRVTRRKDIQAHLRACCDCRQFGDGIQARRKAAAAISPMPAAVTAGLLQAASGGSAVGGGLIAAAGVGAAKSVGPPAIVKLVATAAAVAAIGTASVDRVVVPWTAPAPPAKAQKGERSRNQAPRSSSAGRRDVALSRSPLRAVPLDSVPSSRPGSVAGSRQAAVVVSVSHSRPHPSPARTQIAAVPVAGGHGAHAGSGESTPGRETVASPQSQKPDAEPKAVSASPKATSSQPSGSKTATGPKAQPAKAPPTEKAKPEKAKPEHPPHPEQSQKPVAEVPATAPEATAPAASPEPPAEEEPASSNGLAKGKEKHPKP
jgi:RNA polymerase sigma factor (sigma-70 family)